MSLFIYKKYVKNLFMSLIFLVYPIISMDQSSVLKDIVDQQDGLIQSVSAVTERQNLSFKVEYLDDILSDSTDLLGNVETFEDRYGMFSHEFYQLGLGDFKTFFTQHIRKKSGSGKKNIIVTPEQIDNVVSATEKKIVQAYLRNQEYQNHIHQVILDAIQAGNKVDEVDDALFMHLTTISFLQPVMTAYINAYKEQPYDFDSQDEEDSDYDDRCSYNDEVQARDPLFFQALSCDNDSFIDFFLDYNVNLDFTDGSDNTLLHHAAKSNNTKVTAFLLAKKLHTLNEINDEYQYPLHVAAQYDADKVALQLLENGYSVDRAYDNTVHGHTPLYDAIKYNSDKVSNILIDRGARVENWFLNLAAEHNAYKVIPYLLAAKFQETPQVVIHALAKAAEQDNDQAAQVLLDSFSTEYTPVFLQVHTGTENKFRFEVADESMIFQRKDILYADPLFCAVQLNSEKVMQLFLQHEKINQSNVLQKSNLLEVAVSHDADKIVKLLIAAGMDIHVIGYRDLNLLQRAVKNTAHKSIPLLLEAGLHVDNQMLLSCLQPYLSKLSSKEQLCAISLIQATNNSHKKRKINH